MIFGHYLDDVFTIFWEYLANIPAICIKYLDNTCLGQYLDDIRKIIWQYLNKIKKTKTIYGLYFEII